MTGLPLPDEIKNIAQPPQPETPTAQELASTLISQIHALNTNWDPSEREKLQEQLVATQQQIAEGNQQEILQLLLLQEQQTRGRIQEKIHWTVRQTTVTPENTVQINDATNNYIQEYLVPFANISQAKQIVVTIQHQKSKSK